MKQQILILVVALALASSILSQSGSKPATRPTTPETKPTQELTPKQLKMMKARDLIIPEMTNPIEEKNGVKWSYIRKSKGKQPLLRIGDVVKLHMTLWNQADNVEIMSTRRREGRSHGVVTLNVGIALPGLDLVFPKLRMGDRVRIDIPTDMAFGDAQVPNIPHKADLIYAIEIHGIEKHVPIPKPAKFDEKKAIKINPTTSYLIHKDGTGPIAGDNGIVVYDFLATNEKGRIVDYSKMRKYSIMGGQASKCLPSYLKSFSPIARVGTEFVVRIDFENVAADRIPFGMQGAKYCFIQLFTRWVVPFDSSVKNMKTSESGLQYEIVKLGEGKPIKPTHHVTMHYAWWTTDGDLIESSYARGTTNTLRQVALPKGMVEGLNLIRPGGKIRLKVPTKLAFGGQARKGIPVNSDLIMVIEMFKSEQLDPLKKVETPGDKKPSDKK